MRINHLHAWLLALSNPDGCGNLPEAPLPAKRWADLCKIADYHGVLPAVVNHARYAGETYGIDRLITGKDAGTILEQTFFEARDRLIGRVALSLAIRGQAREIALAFRAAGVPAAVLKGADFADYLYPDPSLRHFTDLDLLVPSYALKSAEETISGLGYVSKEVSMKYESGYGEQSWVRSSMYGGTVEIHWNLVNSPTIRRGVDLAWEDLAFDGMGGDERDGLFRPTAPTRLLIAAVHAAASHSFDRLQPLYDVCLASRYCDNKADIGWLSKTAEKTGAALALTAALGLCRRLFGEFSCSALQHALHLSRRRAWRMLLTPGVVLRGHWQIDSFKRQLFREMLKRR